MLQNKPELVLFPFFIVVALTMVVACSQSGIIIETYPEPIAEVTSVRLEITRGDSSQVLIKANGYAGSAGWTNPVLIGSHLQEPPVDGIYEFEFAAVAPEVPQSPALTRIATTYLLHPLPDDFVGVKIVSTQNHLIGQIENDLGYFEFKGSDETDRFVIRLVDQGNIQHARDLLAGETSDRPSIMGTIAINQVDYNFDWSFHLIPESIDFFDLSIEVCDASMKYVEDHLDEVGGAFLPNNIWCPWSSELTLELVFAN